MLILRLKQAEHAIAAGRLEEAHGIILAAGVREHRRGQDLAAKLVKRLLDRAREHLESDRLIPATADCELAGKLASGNADLAAIRSAIQAKLKQKQHDERRNAGLIEAARQQVVRGQLSIGAKLLAGVDQPEAGAELILREVEARRAGIESMVNRIQSAMKRDDWDAVVDQLASARAGRFQDERIREFAHAAAASLSRRARLAMEDGRLELADALLNRLSRFADQSIEMEEIRGALAQCRSAWQFIERGQAQLAEPILRRLTRIMPRAQWLEEVMADVQLASQAAHRLRGAPLALMENGGVGGEDKTIRTSPTEETPLVSPPTGPQKPAGYRLPPRLVLSVDGVGSFLVLMQSKVIIAPVGASGVPDLGIVADPATPAITVQRDEDDYFLRAPNTIAINDRQAKEKVLSSGDRIAVSPKVRFTFRRPSSASTTAMLDLGSTRVGRADIRNVILMDREVIIGPGASSHVRCDDLPEAMVIVARGEDLVCQAKQDVMVSDSPVGRSAVIPMGASVQVGDVRFVVTKG